VDVFSNLRRPRWVIAFNANGKPVRGPKTSDKMTEAHFLRTPPNGARKVNRARNEQSTSVLGNDAWDKWWNKKHPQLTHLRSSYNSQMQSDDPGILPSKIPLDVQEEIAKRRKEREIWERNNLITPFHKSQSLDYYSKGRHRKQKNRKSRRNKRRKLSNNDDYVSSLQHDVTNNTLNNNNLNRFKPMNSNSLSTDSPSLFTAGHSKKSPLRESEKISKPRNRKSRQRKVRNHSRRHHSREVT